jgi:hypothetical protein
MKVIDASTLGNEVKKLCEEASRGEVVVLTNGAARLFLQPEDDFNEAALDGNEALERELLKGLEGAAAPYSSEEMREALEKALRERKARVGP